MVTKNLHVASEIAAAERDYMLGLHDPDWPTAMDGWERAEVPDGPGAFLRRTISWSPDQKSPKPEQTRSDLLTFEGLGLQRKDELRIEEAIVRFPSAPVYSTHRKRGYQVELNRINHHTLRVLRAQDCSEPISRIYLLHNGLNELKHLSFYYKIAAILTMKDPSSACVIRPLPGHLSRHPSGTELSEQPLDRYLLDPGDLFRQFLRYMVETRWLISAIVPRSDYRVVSGLDLLAVGDRHDTAALSRAILESWKRAHQVAETEGVNPGPEVSLPDVAHSVATIRHLLCRPSSLHDASTPPERGTLRPSLHTVGYSLGGFMAQAVFFAWPFAVSGCTTICSGGALRDIALTAFAHKEEWQTIIHAMRYELDSSFLEQRLRATKRRSKGVAEVAGIDANAFSCFYRLFHDVFVREFAGSYQSRVSEFAPRLLFVLGGRDPIVSTQSVLDASPPEGINLLQIANLAHFPAKGDEHWQGYWLPQATSLIHEFARNAERLSDDTLYENWWNQGRTDHVPTVGTERSSVDQQVDSSFDPETGNEALPSAAFQSILDSFVRRLKNANAQSATNEIGAWLLVLRNEVPAALLGPHVLRKRGTTLHFSEERIWSYFSGLRERETLLLRNQDALTLMVPRRWFQWFVNTQPIFSPKSEAAMFNVPSRQDLNALRKHFLHSWKGSESLRIFAPADNDPAAPSTLPDVWIWLSVEAIQQLVRGPSGDRSDERSLMRTIADRDPKEIKGVKKLVRNLLATDHIKIVRVSSSEFNPRFRGWRIRDWKRAWQLLRHAATCYDYSLAGTDYDPFDVEQIINTPAPRRAH